MSALVSQPGLSAAKVLSIPKDWNAAWFRGLVQNMLTGADVRNAIGANGISVTGNIASPYATITLGPGPIFLTDPNASTNTLTVSAPGADGVGAAGGGRALMLLGAPNSYTMELAGSVTSGRSYGLFIHAGTTSADTSFIVQNESRLTNFFVIRGDGLLNMFGPGTGISSAYSVGSRSTLVLNGGSNGSLIDFQENGTTGGYVYVNGAAGMQINASLGPLNFYATNTLAMTIAQAGGVTIQQPTGGNYLTAGVVNNASFYAVGTYQRSSPLAGYLDGGYSSHETALSPGVIYSIGGASYVPTATTLGTVYGAGFCYTGTNGSAGLLGNIINCPNDAWGLWVATDGNPTIFLDATTGSAYFNANVLSNGVFQTGQGAYLMVGGVSFTNHAAAGAGTLTNAPAAGNPTKWIAIDDNGTVRYIPAW